MRTENVQVAREAYENYAEFYRRSSYSAFPQQHRTIEGTGRYSMILVEQGRHELADPAVEEVVISTPLSAPACSYDWNMGAGWAGGKSRTGDLIVVPPNVESRWRVGGPRKLVILAVPVDHVRSLLGPECPDDLSSALEPLSGSTAPNTVVSTLLQQLWTLGDPDGPLGRMLVDSMVLSLICQVLILAKAGTPHPATGAFSSRDWRRVCDYIDAHLQEEIALADLARLAGWSVRHFTRMFRQSTGQTPHNFIVLRRVERAKDLLKKQKLQLADVALTCGFADQSHFTTSFRKATGLTPMRWRRELV